MAPIDPVTITLAAVNKVSPVIGTISDDLGRLTQQLTSVRGWYDLLIRQNQELQTSLLATASTLVGTNRIIQNGIEIKDPAAAIKALEAPVNEAVQRIREGSLELVGVTSAELIPLLQIVTGQASQIGADLNEAAALTLDFASSFQVLQIPLHSSRQEIVSILTSTLDMNSVLGKSLNLTNQQLNQWKAQGVLVERLRERLEAFRASNAIAARTIDGIASNAAELILTVTQKAGEPLLKPITDGLAAVYDFLKANEGAIADFFNSVTTAIQNVIPPLVDAGNALASQFGTELGSVLASSLDLAVQAFQGLSYAVVGTIKSFVELDKTFPLVSTSIKVIAEDLALVAEGWRKLKAAVDYFSGAQADSDEATTKYQELANRELDNALKIMEKTTPRLKELQQKQKDGTQLTKEETAELAKLQSQRSGAAEGLRMLSKDIGNTNIVGEENQATLKGINQQLDYFAGKLQQTDLAARDIADKGNTFKQLADKVAAAQRTIAEGAGGDDAKLQAANKEIIDLTKQQVELGAVSREEGVKRLAAIRDNVDTEVSIQQAAQKEITEIYKEESDERVEVIKTDIQRIKAAIESGLVGEAVGQAALTRLNREELETRLKDTNDAIKREEELIPFLNKIALLCN